MNKIRRQKNSAKSSNSYSTRPRRRPKADPKRLTSLNIQTMDHLARHLGCEVNELRKWSSNPEKFFRKGIIPHATKPRPKCTPRSPRLKRVLGNLNDLLQRMAMDPAIHGGRRERSPKTNAMPHLAQHTLLKLDIQNFFPSVSRDLVKGALIYRAGCAPEVADVLAAICTPFDQLPQGSPHSMMVAALVIDRMVKRLRRMSEKHGGQCTQYVDDSSISGPPSIGRLESLARRIIESEGFKSNPQKTQVVQGDAEKVVTGLKVNAVLDIPREKIDDLKKAITAVRDTKPDDRAIQSLEGRISYYRDANPGAAKQLRRKLLRLLRTHGIHRK